MPRHLSQTPQQTAESLARATTAKQREKLLALCVRHALRADTKAGAQTVARLFPFPAVQAAAALEWDARQAVLDDFIVWLVEVDEWLTTLPTTTLALFPVQLYPSRMARAALVWSIGRGGIHPQTLRTEFVTCQGNILDTQTS